jgi:hypothetical protein
MDLEASRDRELATLREEERKLSEQPYPPTG